MFLTLQTERLGESAKILKTVTNVKGWKTVL